MDKPQGRAFARDLEETSIHTMPKQQTGIDSFFPLMTNRIDLSGDSFFAESYLFRP